MERQSVSMWTTSNSVYGAKLASAAGAALVPKRPPGTDIGTGRPFPAPNAAQLAPRVPQNWLHPGAASASGAEPLSPRVMLDAVRSRNDASRRHLPSSQRDAARGYSAMLHICMDGSTAMTPRPSGSCDAWWSLGRSADAGPRYYGADP